MSIDVGNLGDYFNKILAEYLTYHFKRVEKYR
jgi:hypothetical protein